MSRSKFSQLPTEQVRMMHFEGNRIIAHLADGSIVEEEFPDRAALSAALLAWAKQDARNEKEITLPSQDDC